MDNGPDWVILLMYWSHDMRHTGFCGLTMVNETPGIGASQLKSAKCRYLIKVLHVKGLSLCVKYDVLNFFILFM